MAQEKLTHKLKRLSLSVIFVAFIVFIYLAVTENEGELSGGYFFYDEGLNQAVITHPPGVPGEGNIPCTVVEHVWDRYFILAKQIAQSDCFWSQGRDIKQEVGHTYFWIIEVDNEKVIGPLDKKAYFNERRKSNVPEDLVLEIDLTDK